MRFLKQFFIIIAVVAAVLYYFYLRILLVHQMTYLEQQKYSEFETVISVRRKTVKLGCESFKVNNNMPERVTFDTILHFETLNLVWCPVLKAGSQAWRRTLLELEPTLTMAQKRSLQAKANDTRINNYLTDKISSPKSVDHLKREYKTKPKPKSFLIVRHPFNRLVSAFRDKLEQVQNRVDSDPKEDYFYKSQGREIVNMFRNMSILKFDEEFFNMENNYGSPLSIPRGKRTKDFPIFWEFVQYLKTLPVSLMDEHWIPISSFCHVCEYDYQTIIRFEDHVTENAYMVKSLISSKGFDYLNLNSQYLKEVDDSVRDLYFQQLSVDDINDLHKIYWADFELFSYKFG